MGDEVNQKTFHELVSFCLGQHPVENSQDFLLVFIDIKFQRLEILRNNDLLVRILFQVAFDNQVPVFEQREVVSSVIVLFELADFLFGLVDDEDLQHGFPLLKVSQPHEIGVKGVRFEFLKQLCSLLKLLER